MDKKVAIGLCLVGSLVVTLSAPAYANQDGHTSNPSNSGNGRNNTSNAINTSTNNANNNGGGTSTVRNPTSGNNGAEDGAGGCSVPQFLAMLLEMLSGRNSSGQNSVDGPCKAMVDAFVSGTRIERERQGWGGGESSDQNRLDRIGDRIARLEELIVRGLQELRSPAGLYQRKDYGTGLAQLGNQLGQLGNLNLVDLLSQWLPQVGGSRPLSGSPNHVGNYQRYLDAAVRDAQGELVSAIGERVRRGVRVAEQTKNNLNEIFDKAQNRSQEQRSKLDEWSKDDGGQPSSELQALQALVRLAAAGNKINSTGHQMVGASIEAGNQIDLEGHATTAKLLTKILEVQQLFAQAQMVALERQDRWNEQFYRAVSSWQDRSPRTTAAPLVPLNQRWMEDSR